MKKLFFIFLMYFILSINLVSSVDVVSISSGGSDYHVTIPTQTLEGFYFPAVPEEIADVGGQNNYLIPTISLLSLAVAIIIGIVLYTNNKKKKVLLFAYTENKQKV